jgi:hypothetical protein
MIEVVNVIISGIDQEKFLNSSIEAKVQWVKKHTVLKDEEKIYKYLSNTNYPEVKGCLSCGELNNKIVRNGNISKTDAVEVTEGNESKLVEKSSAGDNTERSSGTKKRKNKRV